MIAVDTSALIAILRGETEAGRFLELIVDARTCLVSTASVLEASIVLAGRDGGAGSWNKLDRLIAAPVFEVVAQDAVQVGLAREAFLRFGEGRHPAALNFGDCASYALAKQRNVPLLFEGDDFSRTDIVPASPGA